LVSHLEGEAQGELLDNRVLRKIFEPKRDEVTREWKEHYITKKFMLCTPHEIFG
jgi:hypothetical protein